MESRLQAFRRWIEHIDARMGDGFNVVAFSDQSLRCAGVLCLQPGNDFGHVAIVKDQNGSDIERAGRHFGVLLPAGNRDDQIV